ASVSETNRGPSGPHPACRQHLRTRVACSSANARRPPTTYRAPSAFFLSRLRFEGARVPGFVSQADRGRLLPCPQDDVGVGRSGRPSDAETGGRLRCADLHRGAATLRDQTQQDGFRLLTAPRQNADARANATLIVHDLQPATAPARGLSGGAGG